MNSHNLNGIILHLMFTTEMKLYKIFFKFFVTVKTISFILVTCHVSRDQIKVLVTREDDVISANTSFNLFEES